MVRTRFRVTGTVQGVGFRPFVFRHATELGLSGFVRNDSAGVVVEVEGDRAAIDALADALRDDSPPLARVESVSAEDVEPQSGTDGFAIEHSEGLGSPAVPVSIDTAPCPACLRELFDPGGPPQPLPVHELHRLRAALHDRSIGAVRPSVDDDGRVRDVCGLPAGVRRPE